MIFISSYFLTSILEPKKNILGLIYLFLIAFAQIVLTFEILSLFTAINQIWVLILNVLFFTSSMYFWQKKSKPCWSLDCGNFRNRVINSFKLDKSLMWLYVGFCAFLIVTFILCLVLPITNSDAQAYHVARSVFWVLQGSLNHFDVADIRNLCLPINSEILYSWVLLFIKKDALLGFFSFVGYFLSIISIYNILGLLGYSTRKKLWVIFIISSFSSVIVQVSSTETDIIIAGLILSSIFLFWYALKHDKKIPVFMSSLAYALAIGTKTTSLIALPGVGLFLLALCFYFKKYKPLALFLGFGIINFLIFSAYNYILNYIQFSNFMGSTSFMVVSKNYYGIKGLISNFIKYIFMFFDFTGFRWSDYIGPNLTILRDSILKFLHLGYIQDGLYTTPYVVNRLLLEPIMGAGILGFLVYLPCVIRAILNPLFKSKSKKSWFLFVFAVLFIVNMLILSYLLAYMSFSVRFVMSFMLISSPILVYSYLSKKNILKYIIIAFSLFYLMGVSTHLWARPFVKIVRTLIEHPSLTYLREVAQCKTYEKIPQYSSGACPLRHRLQKSFPKDTKILAFLSTSDSIYLLKSLELDGFKIDVRTMEDVKKIDFSKYNIIISTNKGQSATFVKDYEQRKNDYKIIKKKIFITKYNPVPCIYVQNPNILNSKNKEASYPFKVRCAMSKDFLKEKNLELIGITGLVESKAEDFDYYTIYRNTKLPLKFKK
ncbi:MAG: hypothetical protein WCG95_02245 [bacterium]